ncbi:MAG: hypothetical protein ACRDRU_20715 [Pseudonocardiaceae bacterium]
MSDTTDPRNYSVGDRAALVLLSRGSCYWPDCGHPIVMAVKDAEGKYSTVCQIAHIRSAEENGPRYDKKMSNDERRKFPNLIYLCKPHHDLVDDKKHEHKFPYERILKWKTDRETPGQAALAGLRELTEDRLQELISDAYELRQGQILEVLERLEKQDPEAAIFMQQMLEEIEQFRQNYSYMDVDAAIILNQASNNLAGLADTAQILARATDGLKGLRDDAMTLITVVNALGSRGSTLDLLTQLRSLVERLENMRGYL